MEVRGSWSFLTSVLIKGKLPDVTDLRSLTISRLSVSRPVEVHCLEGGLRMHIEFRVVSFEYVFNVCIWESRDWQNSVLFTLVLALHSPLPRSSFFFLSHVLRLR